MPKPPLPSFASPVTSVPTSVPWMTLFWPAAPVAELRATPPLVLAETTEVAMTLPTPATIWMPVLLARPTAPVESTPMKSLAMRFALAKWPEPSTRTPTLVLPEMTFSPAAPPIVLLDELMRMPVPLGAAVLPVRSVPM